MIRKVVFIITYPLNLRDYKRFGAEVIRNNGLEVSFFDMSPFMHPALHEAITASNRASFQGHCHFYTEKEGIDAILGLTEECFAIVIPTYSYETFKIYRAVSKAKIPYALTLSNAFPLAGYSPKCSNNRNLFRKICRITAPKIKNAVTSFLYRPNFSKFLGVEEPRLWLAGGTKSLDIFSGRHPFGKNTGILWVHALDYDIFLENRETKGHIDNKAVFIDPGEPQFRCDDVVIGGRPPTLTKERYYPSICRFFDAVEKESGIRVEIAAHPRSRHELYPDYFGKRLTVRDRTFQMIKDARFIITHFSTAVNFAVLLKKPIIFITTDEFEAGLYGESPNIASVASSLGKKPINIDREFHIDWGEELIVNEPLYDTYENYYIKKKGTEDLNSWQILVHRLKRGL